MKIIGNNLKQFINSPENILELTNSYITEVEEFGPLLDINNLVIGHVLSKEKHPDADTLSVLQIDLGNGLTEQIVCGASNVDKDQYVIVATVGAILPGNFVIKKSKIRGVESNGMVCSLNELGLDEKIVPAEFKEGIYYFGEPKEIGSNALSHLNLDGFIMELSLTPNRSDLLSYYGYAQDLSAALNTEITLPKFEVVEEKEINKLEVKIDSKSVHSYYARHLSEVSITESPLWLKTFLINMGTQPVNNVVDITNYILYTYGTPMHAFDYNKFGSNSIVITDNKSKITLKTLDGTEVNLDSNEVLVTNGSDAMAIGGVMGLENSMITNETKSVILEIANFDSKSITDTSKKLKLKSDSSLRFERGIDQKIIEQALNHATYLLQKYANAKVLKGISKANGIVKENPFINIDVVDISRKIGTELFKKEILNILTRLNYEIKDGTELVVKAPSYRHDILFEYDVLEEVVRLYGMDQVPNREVISSGIGSLTHKQKTVRKIRHYLANMGFNEIVTYSLLNENNVKKFSDLGDIISVVKPLTIDRKSLRQSLINGLLDSTNYNQARSINNVNLFEIGHVYAQGIEKNHLAVSLTNPISNNLWKKENSEIDFYYLSGILDNVLSLVNVEYELVASSYENYHPYQQADIVVKGKKVGVIGQIHPRIKSKKMFTFEIDLDAIDNNSKLKYEPISKYPNVERDLALVLKDDILMSEVLRLIKQTAKKQLVEVSLFDIYKGDHIEIGHKSIAVRMVFNDPMKTLEGSDIDKIVLKIVKRIEFELGGTSR